MSNLPDEPSQTQPFPPVETGTFAGEAGTEAPVEAEPVAGDIAPQPEVDPGPVEAEAPVEPVVEPEPVEAEIVTEPVVEAEPVEAELVPEPAAPGPVAADVEAEPAPVVPAAPEPEPEPVPSALALDDAEPDAPQAADLGAVDTAPRVPGQATNLDLPSLELPHPAPEPVAPPVAFPPAPSFPAGGDYAQNLAQSAYGQPAPQPSPQPTPPPYAGTPYATPGTPQYTQPSFGQEPYGQPGYGQLVPSTQLSATEEATWAAAAHWSSIIGGLVSLPFLGPLLVLLIQGPKSPRVRANAVESLNFDITMTIAMLISFVLIVVAIGLLTTPVLGILWLVMKIVAAVQTNNGQDYRYPLNIRMVK